MDKHIRPVIAWGNSFYIFISLKRFDNGEYIDFDLTTSESIKVSLVCATHNTIIPLDYEIIDKYNLKCFVDYRVLHTNTSYGITVEGIDENNMHWRWHALPKEGFLVISNTSGQNLTEDIQTMDFRGLVGWGQDMSNYYTKQGTETYVQNELEAYYTKEEIQENYYDKDAIDNQLSGKQDVLVSGENIKTINNQTLLGSGNIDIQGGSQVQSNWNESDPTSYAYILNKPTIPSLVKSDWNESDSTSYAYILNKPDLSQKQDVLVSGENIKTINNQSLLGSGNIDIQGGGGSYTAGDNIDITNNEISLKDDIEVHSITTEELYVRQYVSGQIHYRRWNDTPNRFLADNCLTPATEYQAGQEWYNLGQNYVLNIHNGDYSIIGTEWTADNNPPSWLPSSFGNDWYKSTTLVNGEPVYGIYNTDTNSPDFYIYDADNFDWGNIIVDYTDLPLYKEDNPWNNHENGNTDLKNNEGNEFRASNSVIIGNNNSARHNNALLVGTGLIGSSDDTINIGHYNDTIAEYWSLLSIGTGHKGLWVYPSNTVFSGNTIEFDIEFPSNFTPDNNGRLEYALSGDGWWIWVYLYYDFNQQTGTTVNLYDTMNRGEWGDVDKYLVWTVYRSSGKQYHITQTWWDDDQYTTAYNVFGTKTTDNVQYYNWEAEVRRTSFLHNNDGQTKIKAYDSDNLIDVAETLYNLNQNKADVNNLAPVATSGDYNDLSNKPTIPSLVQPNWNESDSSSYAYILNKPDLSQKQDVLVSGQNIKTINNQSLLGSGNIDIQGGSQVQSDWNENDPTSYAYILNKPTIPSLVQPNWNESDSSSYAYILNKPTIPSLVQPNWNENDSSSYAYILNKPTLPDFTYMVTSTTAGVKIEIVNALPANPDTNTIYIVL